MKTLTIEDLPFNDELNRKRTAGVRGGTAALYAPPGIAPGEPHPLPFNLDEVLKRFPGVTLPWMGPNGVDPRVAVL